MTTTLRLSLYTSQQFIFAPISIDNFNQNKKNIEQSTTYLLQIKTIQDQNLILHEHIKTNLYNRKTDFQCFNINYQRRKKNIQKKKEKLFSITKLPFSKLGDNDVLIEITPPSKKPIFQKMANNEVPCDDLSEFTSDKPTIPPFTDYQLSLIMIPGYLQAMK